MRKSVTASAKTPAHQNVYTAIRELILFGDVVPGEALTIQGLQARLGAGMTPVREALRRLTSEGAVEMLGNRRICVPVLTTARVEELFFIRKMLEPELARRAAQNISGEGINALKAIDARLNEAIEHGDVKGYMRHNYLFHNALYSHSNAPMMLDTVDRLWLRFGPSQREICGRWGTANLPDRHAELLEALRARDAFGAARSIGDDILQGMTLYLSGSEQVDAE